MINGIFHNVLLSSSFSKHQALNLMGMNISKVAKGDFINTFSNSKTITFSFSDDDSVDVVLATIAQLLNCTVERINNEYYLLIPK